MIGPRCSSADYATTQRAWSEEKGFYQTECAPRVNEQIFGKKMFRKIMHKRHGQTRNNALKVLTIRMQNDHDLVVRAVAQRNAFQPHLKLKVPDVAGIPAFAAEYWRFQQEARDRSRTPSDSRVTSD